MERSEESLQKNPLVIGGLESSPSGTGISHQEELSHDSEVIIQLTNEHKEYARTISK